MTPLQQFGDVYLKREDLNETGSAKDRAIKVQIANLIKNNYLSTVISSSGNAAISASYFCKKNQIPLTIFLSPNTSPNKIKLLNPEHKIIYSSQPIRDAFQFSKVNKSYFLRQSTDPNAALGYSAIAEEIQTQLPDVTSIFIPTGSGTTLHGISMKLTPIVKIFACQPASNPHITRYFDITQLHELDSITDSLTVKFTPLKKKIIEVITKSNGYGLSISKAENIQALKEFQKNGISTSPEGALAYAAYKKALSQKLITNGKSVILLTGSDRNYV